MTPRLRRLIRSRYDALCRRCSASIATGQIGAWIRGGGMLCLACNGDELRQWLVHARDLIASPDPDVVLRALGWGMSA